MSSCASSAWGEVFFRNGILLPKLFWPTLQMFAGIYRDSAGVFCNICRENPVIFTDFPCRYCRNPPQSPCKSLQTFEVWISISVIKQYEWPLGTATYLVLDSDHTDTFIVCKKDAHLPSPNDFRIPGFHLTANELLTFWLLLR